MPFEIPTQTESAQNVANTFRAELKGSDARLWPNNVAVSAKVLSQALWGVYSFLDYISKQTLVHTAEGQWLDRHGLDFGMPRKSAAKASGSIDIAGSDPGIEVPSGLECSRADGVRYVTTSGGTTDISGDLTVTVQAVDPGRTANAIEGVSITITTPLDGLNPAALVSAGGIGLGADIESDAAYRERILYRKRNPPHGGAAHDYVIWASQVPGVTRVFVDPISQANMRTTVGIWFLMDDSYADGIPQAADVTAVEDHIEPLRPAGAPLAIAAPTGVSVDIEIANLSEDTVAVRSAIATELSALFRRLSVSTVTDPVTVYRSQISEAISAAIGEAHHDLVTPVANVTLDEGEVATLGDITYS